MSTNAIAIPDGKLIQHRTTISKNVKRNFCKLLLLFYSRPGGESRGNKGIKKPPSIDCLIACYSDSFYIFRAPTCVHNNNNNSRLEASNDITRSTYPFTPGTLRKQPRNMLETKISSHSNNNSLEWGIELHIHKRKQQSRWKTINTLSYVVSRTV